MIPSQFYPDSRAAAAPRTSSTAHVLTVTPAERDRRALEGCFRGACWSLMHATDVRSSRELLARGEIDVIVADMRLPDGSWSDLLESPSTPVVVVTDVLEPRSWAEALSCGAYDVLLKPFHTEEVLYVVRNAWRSKAARRSEQSQCSGGCLTEPDGRANPSSDF